MKQAYGDAKSKPFSTGAIALAIAVFVLLPVATITQAKPFVAVAVAQEGTVAPVQTPLDTPPMGETASTPSPEPVDTPIPTLTLTNSPSPAPTDTPASSPESAAPAAPIEANPITPSTPAGPSGESEGDPGLMLLLAAVAGAGAILAAIAFWMLRKQGRSLIPRSRTRSQPAELPATLPDDTVPVVATLTSHRPPPGTPFLEGLDAGGGVLYYSLARPAIKVGRAVDNDLVIDGRFTGWQTVSQHHAMIECDGAQVIVRDDGSDNGVHVNGRRTGANALREGWTVSFGQVSFVLHMNPRGGAR